MIDKGNKSEQEVDLFEDKVMKFPGISPSAGYVALAWRRLQDTRTNEQDKHAGYWLVQMWELEEATNMSRSTVRAGINQLVKYQIIAKQVIKANQHRGGELWLTRISIASLEQASLNSEIPEPTIRQLPVCKACGSVHTVQALSQTCKDCGTSTTLYQTDYGYMLEHVRQFCNMCLLRKHACQITIATMMKLYKCWFWTLEECELKKALKNGMLARVFLLLGIHYRVSNSYRRYEGVGISPYGQSLLEGIGK